MDPGKIKFSSGFGRQPGADPSLIPALWSTTPLSSSSFCSSYLTINNNLEAPAACFVLSGMQLPKERAGSCMTVVYLLVDVFGNERSCSSCLFFLMHLPLFCLLPRLSSVHSAHKASCSSSCRGQGNAVSAQKCGSSRFM